MQHKTDEETGLPLVGGPFDSSAEELLEIPIPPQIIVELKKAEENFGVAQAYAANMGLAVLDVLRQGFSALRKLDDAKMEHNRMMGRAAKSTGVGEERVRTFDLERGVALYTKKKQNN